MAPRIDWAAHKTLFVEGELQPNGRIDFLTLKEVSERFNTDYRYVRRVAAEQHWQEERAAFERSLDEARRRNKIEKRIERIDAFEEDCAQISTAGLQHIKIHFNALMRSAQEGKAVDHRMLESLSRAAERFQKVGCVAFGLPNENLREEGQVEHKIDLSRLPDDKLFQLREIARLAGDQSGDT